MTMHIEAATEVDVPALSKLLAVLFAQEAEFTPNPEVQCRGLPRIITNREVGIVLVAKEGETVLGMVILLYTVSTALGGESRYLKIWLLALRLAAVALGLICCKGRLRLPKQLGACLSRYSQINRICRLSASTSGMGSRHPPWFRCICIWRSVNRDLPNISSQWTCYAGR